MYRQRVLDFILAVVCLNQIAGVCVDFFFPPFTNQKQITSNDQLKGLSCACINNRARHEVLLGGELPALYSFDLEKGRILKEVLPLV